MQKNLAEQAVRFVVIDRRITQGTRSEKGCETNERLWTIVGTCELQGRSAFEFILAAVRACFHGDPAPSLLSAFGRWARCPRRWDAGLIPTKNGTPSIIGFECS